MYERLGDDILTPELIEEELRLDHSFDKKAVFGKHTMHDLGRVVRPHSHTHICVCLSVLVVSRGRFHKADLVFSQLRCCINHCLRQCLHGN